MPHESLRAIAFVARCSGAATVAYELASWLGLPEALWAAMSAVIVSQEDRHATRSSLTGRILGTLLGIAVTLAVSAAGSRVSASTIAQMAVAVAITAVVAQAFPALRVAMWTCPVILLSGQPSLPILLVAARRGTEVVLAALVGWAFHWVAEVVVDGLAGSAPIGSRGAGTPARRR